MGYNKFLGVITLTFSLQPNLRHEKESRLGKFLIQTHSHKCGKSVRK